MITALHLRRFASGVLTGGCGLTLQEGIRSSDRAQPTVGLRATVGTEKTRRDGGDRQR